MKRVVKLLALAAVITVVVAALRRRPAPPSASPTAPPSPKRPVVPEAPTTPAGPAVIAAPGVDPTADGVCPDGYPVKAKLKSKIFHVPGGVLYERTVPDRCYASPEAAQADGLRASLR
jgi:hypothetical protein